ncbi:MAG: hypothetical protein AB7V42_11945 [Thermoleophilia bacterium]
MTDRPRTAAIEPAERRAIEDWFRARGLPYLVAGDDARDGPLRWLRLLGRSLVTGFRQRALEGLADTAAVAVRAMPPLLAVLLFLSMASETWQAFGRLEGWRYGAVLTGFGLLSLLILTVGLRRDRRALYSPAAGPGLAEAARRTPARPLVERGVVPAGPPLVRAARANITATLVEAIALRVLAVGVAVGVAFFLFGLALVDRGLTAEWVGREPNVLLALRISGREVVVTEALVRVATALGAFAALYFSAVALGEERNRREFLDDEVERVEDAMACWSYYRGAIAAGDRAEPPAA